MYSQFTMHGQRDIKLKLFMFATQFSLSLDSRNSSWCTKYYQVLLFLTPQRNVPCCSPTYLMCYNASSIPQLTSINTLTHTTLVSSIYSRLHVSAPWEFIGTSISFDKGKICVMYKNEISFFAIKIHYKCTKYFTCIFFSQLYRASCTIKVFYLPTDAQ